MCRLWYHPCTFFPTPCFGFSNTLFRMGAALKSGAGTTLFSPQSFQQIKNSTHTSAVPTQLRKTFDILTGPTLQVSKRNNCPTLPLFGSWIKCRGLFDYKDGCACTIGRAVPCEPPAATSIKQEPIDAFGTDDARKKRRIEAVWSKWFLRLIYWRTECVVKMEPILPGWMVRIQIHARDDDGCEEQPPDSYGRQNEEFSQHVSFQVLGGMACDQKVVSKREVMASPAYRAIPWNLLLFSVGSQLLATMLKVKLLGRARQQTWRENGRVGKIDVVERDRR